MKISKISALAWGNKARLSYLMIATVILLFTFLGAREIWTQEHRWADIVAGMFYRHDFLHPYLGEARYYDKPLLSYWFIALFAYIGKGLSAWALRLPSALAGCLAVWSIYRLGSKLKNVHLGLLSGWMLLTTFYFVFWARTSSADMLNLAGTLFAIAWYFDRRERSSFFSYAVFFMILAVTALCKGLVGAIIPILAVFTDMCLARSWKQHLRLPLFLALIPACIVYLAPFFASSYFDGDAYGQNGLYLVYRENILRYFEPFDHQGPIYTYFVYLPIYLLPWTVLFIPALVSIRKRYKSMSMQSKWIVWSLLVVFLFFTLSGSRRSYYVLPIVPFAILFTADWVLAIKAANTKRSLVAAGLVVFGFIFILLSLDILPAWYYSRFGVERFAETLKTEVQQVKPFADWNVVMLDAETKLNFYLQLPPHIKNLNVIGLRDQQTSALLLKAWPILKNKPANTIFITRARYVPLLLGDFVGYKIVQVPYDTTLPFINKQRLNAPVAFVPRLF